jgi:hypothetical protein
MGEQRPTRLATVTDFGAGCLSEQWKKGRCASAFGLVGTFFGSGPTAGVWWSSQSYVPLAT